MIDGMVQAQWRREVLDELRRRRTVEQCHGLTPAERVAKAEALRHFAAAIQPAGGTSDERVADMLAMLSRFRARDLRR